MSASQTQDLDRLPIRIGRIAARSYSNHAEAKWAPLASRISSDFAAGLLKAATRDATRSTAISARDRKPFRFLATQFVGDINDRLSPTDRIDSALGRIIVGHFHAEIDLP